MSIPVTIDPLGTLGAGEPLPPGYTRVKCLVSNGHQLIDTLHVPTALTRWELDYAYIGASMGSTQRQGMVNSNSGYRRFEFSAEEQVFGGANAFDLVSSNVSSLQRAVSVLDNKRGEFRVGETVIATAPVDYGAAAVSLSLCGRHSNYGGTASSSRYDITFSCKIYRSTICENDVLVQDLVPCLDDNGTACMYDLVGGEAYRAVKPSAYDLQPFGYEL